jgi:tRNA(Arg) A34 adenosine deaminase TadA
MTISIEEHEKFMRVAIELSKKAGDGGNFPFAAILVKDGEVLLETLNGVDTEHDCTQHAEVRLASLATRTYDGEMLKQCVFYTSAEPCPMCAGAIYWTGIPTMVYGNSDETLMKYHGKSFSIPCRDILTVESGVEVIGPLLEDEAEAVHKKFVEKRTYDERWG